MAIPYDATTLVGDADGVPALEQEPTAAYRELDRIHGIFGQNAEGAPVLKRSAGFGVEGQ